MLLLVDDEPALLELGRRFIERDGRYAVEVALSGEEALSLLEAGHFIAIVSDYEMPGLTGIELLQRIRTAGIATPFIIFTGRGREEVAMEALNSGASYYLQKGGDARAQFGELLHLVDQAVRTAEAERTARVSTGAYRTIFEYSGAASVILEHNTRIALVNSAFERLSGYRRDELVGSTRFFDFVAEEDRERLLGYHRSRRIDPGQVPVQYEFRFRDREGREHLVATTVGMIPGTQRSVVSLIDVTVRSGDEKGSEPQNEGERLPRESLPAQGMDPDRRQSEMALLRANEKLNLLSSITRHDIQNQLTLLAGYLDLARDDCHEPVVRSYLNGIRQASDAIARQIAFTKIYQDIGVRSARWHRVREVAEQAAGSIAPGELRVEVAVGDLEVHADPLFERVIENLVENTIRHGRSATRIRFSCAPLESGLVILAEDDGVGVRAEEKEWIFERGFGRNTGFGLFLAREILGITGITIQETGTPGNGARFEITVPEGRYRFPVEGHPGGIDTS
ncbi:MAG TPA: PAS domain S-box protein [Methanoregulaceae archaeon]|nr:PAS domain S-box protein [Methanoregulaceae archaeon]HQJ88523.1 PAS domain S-box protein [Methanoregulaceae archaeon]